jgi:hypothetical protein
MRGHKGTVLMRMEEIRDLKSSPFTLKGHQVLLGKHRWVRVQVSQSFEADPSLTRRLHPHHRMVKKA